MIIQAKTRENTYGHACNEDSNALVYVTRRLIGQSQKFATVYSVIYCRKSEVGIWFYSAHSTCHYANSTFFQQKKKMNKCIRMGITAFKFVIWGGKSAVLRSQITFYDSADALP